MADAGVNGRPFSEELAKLMGKGKRHYICNEVEEAVKCFEEATQRLDKEYGQLAKESGEAYLYYGKSLIDLARLETGVLGGALKVGEDQNEDDSDDDEDATEDNQMETEETPDKDKSVEENTAEKTGEPEKNDQAAAKSKEKKADTEESSKTECAGENGEVDAKENLAKQETNDMAGTISEEKQSADTTSNKDKPKEDKAGEDKDKEDKAKGDKPKEDKDGEDKDGEDKDGEDKDGEDKDGEDKDGEDKDGEDKDGEDKDGEDKDGEDKDGEDKDGEDKDGEDGDPTEQEELTTMELAWDILEVSRLIHEGQETMAAKLNLAQTYLKLGEIQMERELFLEAVDEFHKCYQIQQKHLESDDRLLAETLYNIGLAHSIQSPPQYKESKEFYTKALDVIDLRIKNIEARLQEFDAKSKGKQKASDDDPCVKDRKELHELQDLYPEIKAKIDDAQEMLTNADTSKAEPIQSIAVKKPNGDTAKPVTDISHLVKRKRKPEESETSENIEPVGPAKKPRQENSTENTNGHDITS